MFVSVHPAWKLLGGNLTFVLQRVAGSYFHSSAYRLSRTVHHLVVGKSDIKFLKLSHGSAPPQLCVSESSEKQTLRSHLLRLVTSHWRPMIESDGRDDNWFILQFVYGLKANIALYIHGFQTFSHQGPLSPWCEMCYCRKYKILEAKHFYILLLCYLWMEL